MDRLEALKKALEKDPNNPLGLYGYAMELYKNKKYNEAIEIFKNIYLFMKTRERLTEHLPNATFKLEI